MKRLGVLSILLVLLCAGCEKQAPQLSARVSPYPAYESENLVKYMVEACDMGGGEYILEAHPAIVAWDADSEVGVYGVERAWRVYLLAESVPCVFDVGWRDGAREASCQVEVGR